ncbi:hypothetical protein NL676_039665 [Syzygium grande]|nr:hypothetical protein NL676_039665 [Syzygium grande]
MRIRSISSVSSTWEAITNPHSMLLRTGTHFHQHTCPTISNFGFNEDRSHSSGKAVIGWLKLKAALRWGIFCQEEGRRETGATCRVG